MAISCKLHKIVLEAEEHVSKYDYRCINWVFNMSQTDALLALTEIRTTW